MDEFPDDWPPPEVDDPTIINETQDEFEAGDLEAC